MSSFLLGLVLFSIMGITVFSTQGIGVSLDTTSDVNKIEGLSISDYTGQTLLRTDLGTTEPITSVTLEFTDNYGDGTIDLTINDGNGNVIGYGTLSCSGCGTSNVVTLSNQVTSQERDVLRAIIVRTT